MGFSLVWVMETHGARWGSPRARRKREEREYQWMSEQFVQPGKMQDQQLIGGDVEGLRAEIEEVLRAQSSLKTAEIRALRRKYSSRLAHAPARSVIELAIRLLDGPGSVSRFVAYELVCHHRAALRSLSERELEQLGSGINSWDTVDTFACYLAGPAWREHQIPDALIHLWARSADRWWRRAAVVSTVALNNKARGGIGDTDRTLSLCSIVVEDHDEMVVKALSWALRELSKRDPQAVQSFLTEHEDQLAARVRREVRHKLATGLKNPRRQSMPRRVIR
jgi:3-methyladenine DNA glycosylase AlkD